MVQQAYQLVSFQPVDYVNLGDAVHSTWAGCAPMGNTHRVPGVRIGSDEWLRPGDASLCTGLPPCASMAGFIASSWKPLALALGLEAGALPPPRLAEINGNEAIVARCRLRLRPLSFWEALRNLTREHHSQLAFGLEGSFHVIMGEPWVRPFISSRHANLNFVACGVNATDTLWPGQPPDESSSAADPDFTINWLRYTELSLRQRLPGGGDACS